MTSHYSIFTVFRYHIDVTNEQCRAKLREMFYKNQNVKDLRVIDILVIKVLKFYFTSFQYFFTMVRFYFISGSDGTQRNSQSLERKESYNGLLQRYSRTQTDRFHVQIP